MECHVLTMNKHRDILLKMSFTATPGLLKSGKLSLASPAISWEADTCNTHLYRNYLTGAIFSMDTFFKVAEGSLIPDS